MDISVALITYNGEKYIIDQLKSIVEQTAPPSEIIVCDDCSSDNTVSRIHGFLNDYPVRVKLQVNAHNMGYNLNMSQAISMATGEIILLSDQDDIWKSDKIDKLISILERNPLAQMAFCDSLEVDQNLNSLGMKRSEGKRWPSDKRSWDIDDAMDAIAQKSNNIAPAHCIAIRSSLIGSLYPLPALANQIMNIDEWISLVACVESLVVFEPEILVLHRIHNSNFSGATTRYGPVARYWRQLSQSVKKLAGRLSRRPNCKVDYCKLKMNRLTVVHEASKLRARHEKWRIFNNALQECCSCLQKRQSV